MIKLSRISLVHWHLFGKADLDVFGDTAILGRNRSGKSTLIDLVQTVMAGGSRRHVRFNQSAGESRGRSDRSLKSYCLGQLSDEAPSRKEAITHIALCFEDEAGARPPVTIGLCIEASRDEATVVGRYVAIGWKSDSDLFVDQRADGVTKSAAWPAVQERLARRCGEVGGRLILSSTATAHVREYIAALFTDRRTPVAEQFLKAFVLALSFEDMHSVELFVRRYLLEERDIDIAELRESIQRYREIRKTIEDLQARLEALKLLQVHVQRHDDLLKRETSARGVVALAGLVEAGNELFGQLTNRRKAMNELRKISADIEAVKGELDAAKATLESLLDQERQSDVAEMKRELERQRRSLEEGRTGVIDRIKARHRVAAKGTTLLTIREALKPMRLGEVTMALEAVRTASEGLAPPDWPRDPQTMDELLERLAQAAAERLETVQRHRNEALAQSGANRQALDAAREDLGAARAGKVVLSAGTRVLMEVLRQEGMTPQPLCEVLSVNDEQWRLAAESLLGAGREALLVAPEHSARAISILRQGRKSPYSRCLVVNTDRLKGAVADPRPGTLASVLSGENPLAMAYVVNRIGNIELAEDQEQLTSGGRAVLAEGTYYDGLVVRLLHERDFKIGQAAAGLMEPELLARIADLESIGVRLDQNAALLEDVVARLTALAAPVDDSERLPVLMGDLGDLDERLADVQSRLVQVEQSISPDLRAAIAQARIRAARAEADLAALGKEGEAHRVTIQVCDRLLQGGENQAGSWFCLNARRRRFKDTVGRQVVGFLSVRRAYEVYRPKQPERIALEAQKDADHFKAEAAGADAAVREGLITYRHRFNDEAPSGAEHSIQSRVRPWLEEQIEALEGNELIQYRQQAEDAAEQVGRVFRTDFVHELNSRFSQLQEVIAGLNRALKDRPLHNEIYMLKAQVREELSGLHRLARESEHDDHVLDALFGRAEPRDPEHAAALKEIEVLLEGVDADFEAYQDYRNYYVFDLQMRDMTSNTVTSFDRRRGVASGAERQVPFYVVIGAALANLYHGSRNQRTRDDLGVGLAVFDEAFSKMDGPNQRTLLTFYDEIGLQVLIAAPSEKRNVIYENLESVIDVYRRDNHATAQTTHIREKARKALRQANPEHLSDADLKAMMEIDEGVAAE
ncbi:Chromosome partition protein Smc [compost metagenome]